MPDQFNVSASWSKASYNAGETMTGTISGTNTHTTTDTTTTESTGPVSIPVVSDSGSQSVVILPAVSVVRTTPGVTTTEAVSIDAAAFATSQGGRIWTVSADRRSISAVA